MLRVSFSFFFFLFISSLSFLLTSLFIKSIKELDPIMILIKSKLNLYEVEAVNAYVDDFSIIPGKKGVSINIDSSYTLMKKYGTYDDNLLVFDEISPSISILNIYNRYVISGNKNVNNISFVFKFTDTNYLEEIISILKKEDVIGTFFMSDEVLLQNPDIIKLLYVNNQNIESLGNNNTYNLNSINKINYLLKGYTGKSLNYCYTDEVNKDILSVCSSKKMHTIIPTINTDKYPYYDIKNKLENGVIIKFNNNNQILKELNYVITYIRQKNYNIVSLEKLLSE